MKVTKEQFIGVTYDELLAENAKLREQSERLFDKTLELATENSKLRELCKLCEREVDNAKLRELCAGLLTGYECGYGELCKGCTWDGLGDSKTFSCLPRVKARDLGVEVDG